MNATMDDLLIIIGRQTVQIALLEAELALKAEPPTVRVPISDEEKAEIMKVFDESR